jgi:predicted phage terminase large subunit-like protein
MPHWYYELLRNDFSTFIGKTFSTVNPGGHYLPNWHIRLISHYLEAARRKEITRLIINMPPRALKSICISVAWPAWLLGHNPRNRIIGASYSASLSVKHSLDCRHVLGAPWYRTLFPETRLLYGQNQKHKFTTSEQGYRFATSVGGSLTGEGGDFLIIDDPLNPLQAMNVHWRDHVNRWFDHTIASRLDDKRTGAIVLVMQRLHAHDLTGYLLAKGGWQHLSLPAVAAKPERYEFGRAYVERKVGDLLHPERENTELIERAKIELGSHAFAAQYQQAPLEEEGAMVRQDWFGRYREIPSTIIRRVQSWDTAIKNNAHNDASVCLTFGEENGRSYLLDVRLFRYEYPDLKKMVYTLAEQWRPNMILIEDKGSGQQLLQDIRRETELPAVGVMPKSDKITRFAAVTAMLEAGRVVLPEQAPWLADFESELFSFPDSRHDDQVDALSQYLDWIRGCSWERLRIRSI